VSLIPVYFADDLTFQVIINAPIRKISQVFFVSVNNALSYIGYLRLVEVWKHLKFLKCLILDHRVTVFDRFLRLIPHVWQVSSLQVLSGCGNQRLILWCATRILHENRLTESSFGALESWALATGSVVGHVSGLYRLHSWLSLRRWVYLLRGALLHLQLVHQHRFERQVCLKSWLSYKWASPERARFSGLCQSIQ
jgi:hypothetical protein